MAHIEYELTKKFNQILDFARFPILLEIVLHLYASFEAQMTHTITHTDGIRNKNTFTPGIDQKSLTLNQIVVCENVYCCIEFDSFVYAFTSRRLSKCSFGGFGYTWNHFVPESNLHRNFELEVTMIRDEIEL